MRYRIKPSEKEYFNLIREKKPFRRAGADSPRRLYGYRADAIDMEALFELRKLEGRVKRNRGARFKKALVAIRKAAREAARTIKAIATRTVKVLRVIFHAVKNGVLKLCGFAVRFIEKRRARKRGQSNVHILAGAACGVLLVSLVSGYAVLYKLLLRDHFGSYERIRVPDMVGMDYTKAREELDEEYYNITVSYEYSASEPAGRVISQTPTGNAERKIYSGGEPCPLNIVVSRGKQMIEMKNYAGTDARDAELELRNASFSVIVLEEFSDSVQAGQVISTTPRAKDMLEVGGLAVLRVSAGKKIELLRVPDIRGLNENDAAARIVSSGFKVGKVTYKSSLQKAGTVVEQQIEPKSELERGSEISFTVSAGEAYSDKTMPSLYGMNVSEARAKLAEYGLVCGNIYAVESKERTGIVIAQSPAANSVLSGTAVSVDLYVSS